MKRGINMSGTKIGGLRAAETNKQKHGKDFYANIGKVGGKAKNPNKGFGSMTPEKRIEAARRGGKTSKRKLYAL